MVIVVKTQNSIYWININDDGFVVEKRKSLTKNQKDIPIKEGDRFKGTTLHLKKGESMILWEHEHGVLRTSRVVEIVEK